LVSNVFIVNLLGLHELIQILPEASFFAFYLDPLLRFLVALGLAGVSPTHFLRFIIHGEHCLLLALWLVVPQLPLMKMLKNGKAMMKLKFLVLEAGHVLVPCLSILGLHNNSM
jgi:hypothetical protein